MPLVQRIFIFFKWLKGLMALVQRLFFFFGKVFSFFGKDLEILKFFLFWIFFWIFFINIYMNKVHQMLHGFLEFKETWNKLTNVKLNHDVANQMWSEAKLGHLLLLSPFRMLETRYAWTLIMIKWLGLALGRLEPWLWSFGICLKWLGLTLGRHASCEFLAFDVAHAHTPLVGSSVELRIIQETILGFHTK